jgi:Aspartyl/Asparaginyl beta-hydroxylase
MLDIPAAPYLDKAALVGGCVRLPLKIDSLRLLNEIARLPAVEWGTRGGRVGVHNSAEAIFLRGHAPAEGEKPVEDRPNLDRLLYTRIIIEQLIPAPPLRCLLARLPAGAVIAPHVDRAPYFGKTLRVHVPVETNESVFMVSRGLCYSMQPGEAWMLNNSAEHAVWNSHPLLSRTHLICDFLPSPALLELLLRGERDLGVRRADVEAYTRESRPAGAASIR